VLVQSETDFAELGAIELQFQECYGESCNEGGSGGGGGGSGDPSPCEMSYSPSYSDIWMCELRLENVHEPWTRGSPEIVVALVEVWSGGVEFLSQAHEDNVWLADDYFNMDSKIWRSGRGVKIGSTAFCPAIVTP
jgi:hypothetical protein